MFFSMGNNFDRLHHTLELMSTFLILYVVGQTFGSCAGFGSFNDKETNIN